MKYLLLVHHDEEVLNKIGEPELEQMRAESVLLANEINSKGQYVDAAPLYAASTGTCVRVRHGQRLVTDGPFAETREQLGGYFLIEARDLAEAVDLAAPFPGAQWDVWKFGWCWKRSEPMGQGGSLQFFGLLVVFAALAVQFLALVMNTIS
jgi:hypothetical protein